MYFHARQFPHLAGLNDSEIRELARRAMSRQPSLIRIMQIRNIVVLIGVVAAIALLREYAALRVGVAFMIVGAVSTAFVLAWNLIWANTVIFRLTCAEVKREAP